MFTTFADAVYWDDIFPQSNFDTVGTDAYMLPGGTVQPSAGIWNMRALVRSGAVLAHELGKPNRNMVHITNTAIAITPGSTAIEYYGKSAHTSVDNCQGGGNSNAPFDTHPAATDWSFADCTSVASFRGRAALGSGFQVRGDRIQLVNCRS